jgi:alginate O-acetyltransferase complex protein AlgI
VNPYLPTSPELPAAYAALLAGVTVAGMTVARLGRLPSAVRAARAAAWIIALGGTAAAERLCAAEPPGVRMLAIIGALLLGMKSVVAVEAAAAPGASGVRLTLPQSVAFWLLWPGMRPATFATLGGPSQPGAASLLRLGLVRLAQGLALIGLARWVWVAAGEEGGGPVALWGATLLLMAGLSLCLHFGLFNIAAGLWRWAGADAKQLFRAPLASADLDEFWARRWNLAFSEMTALAVYRPLSGAVGRGPALVGAFLASGLLHEAAISLPVNAGYGWPMLYFALHGGLVAVERRLKSAFPALTARPAVGRCWTLFWVFAPAPLLFHRPFLDGVVRPIIGA